MDWGETAHYRLRNDQWLNIRIGREVVTSNGEEANGFFPCILVSAAPTQTWEGMDGMDTGRAGIEPLIRAWRHIEFFMQARRAGEPQVMVIGWADERRRRAYSALTRFGFSYVPGDENQKAALIKWF